jgi:hypothetical protein
MEHYRGIEGNKNARAHWIAMNRAMPPVLSKLPKHSRLAIWSLVLGILSPACLFFVAGIPAVVCGHLARKRIQESDGALTGNGLAMGGLVTGYLGIAVSVLIPLYVMQSIPKQVKAREAYMRNICTNNLQLIQTAKQTWASENKKAVTEIPTKADLLPYLPNQQWPRCPGRGDYSIKPVAQPPECPIPSHKLQPPPQ